MPTVYAKAWHTDRDEHQLVALVERRITAEDHTCVACPRAPLDLLLLATTDKGLRLLARADQFDGKGAGDAYELAPDKLALDSKTPLVAVRWSYTHHGNGAGKIELFKKNGDLLEPVFKRFWPEETWCGDLPPETDGTFEFCSVAFSVSQKAKPELIEIRTCVTRACREASEYGQGSVRQGKKTRYVYRWNGKAFAFGGHGPKPRPLSGFEN